MAVDSFSNVIPSLRKESDAFFVMSNINTSMDKSIQKSSTPDFLDCKQAVNEADRLTLVNETQSLLEDDLLKNHSELRQAQIHTAKACHQELRCRGQ